MNATPPEARAEYSRAPEEPKPVATGLSPRRRRLRTGTGAGGATALAGALLGALSLSVAELTTLYEVHTADSPVPVKSVGTGSNHAYGLLVIALCVAALGYAVWRAGSRPALLAIGVLGVTALLIGLLGDLPDASATGLISHGGHYVNASSTPSAGLYLETLGAAILIVTCVSGFILLGPPDGGSAARLRPGSVS
jgi:hypothetical protein